MVNLLFAGVLWTYRWGFLFVPLSPSPSVGLRRIPRFAQDRNFIASCALRAGPPWGEGGPVKPLAHPPARAR